MSNDEYKATLVNNNHYYFAYPTIHHNGYNDYQTVFSALQSDHKNSIGSFNNFTYTKSNEINNNAKRSSHKNHSVTTPQLRPMNLITNQNNTGLDLSHSIRKQFSSYCATESLPPIVHNNNSSNNCHNSYASSPSSSNSPSIDVENDIDDNSSSDRIMSPVSIPTHQQKSILTDSRSSSQNSLSTMELTAGSIPSGFPLNYQQLYANNAALYGAPVMFSGAIHAAHASYMAGLPLHSALSPNDSYLKAIQAAACGIYSPTALAPPPPPPSTVNPSLMSHKPPSSLHNPANSLMALAPSTHSLGVNKSPQQQQHQQYSPNMLHSRITEVEQHQQQQQPHQPKKDYLAPPPAPPLPSSSSTSTTSSATTTRLCTSANSSGTYLNDKVNERLTSVDAIKDSHFKVPNGKEGSLKHRILRPPSNSELSTDTSKTPTMRAYSTASNFKKGNYIELANGALRRVEDMRTEDFIQCAERSPHHQLAESTVVKINTSLPSTAVITFSYDRNRSKVDMEVSMDHPFFVYGQGWASCNPEMSMKMFGLKCQRLQVGDICISLTKREPPVQATPPPVPPATQTHNSMSPLSNEGFNYQRRHTLTATSPNANHKSPTLTTMNATPEMPYSPINAHAFSIPVPQTNHHQHHLQQQHLQQQQQQQLLHQQQQQQQHHLQQQQQHQHQQVQQQAYAEMAKLMSSYAYAKGLPQLPHEQLKEVMLDAGMLQSLPPKMMNAFYQNQIFQFAQQQQEHLRQHDLKNSLQRTSLSSSSSTSTSSSAVYHISAHNNSQSPQPTDLENNQNQPPQTQPLDASMSRKRRWSAPENMFDDDDETETQPPRNGSSPATARS